MENTNIINEELARRAKQNMSFSEYKQGSATAEYNSMVETATEQAAKYLDNEKVVAALERYKRDLCKWFNEHNARGANHVSWFISGPANYNMRAHERWEKAESKGWERFTEIKENFQKSLRGADAPLVIKSTDVDALDALQAKLDKEQAFHDACIEHNKKARRGETDKPQVEPYVLSNSNQRIAAIKTRIATVQRMQTREARRQEFDGGYFEENKEAGRTQIFFENKPDEAMRTKLKSHGWRWSPNNGCWQRQLTNDAWYCANHYLFTK